MKLIQNAAIGVCLLASISVQAQQSSNDTTTHFTPPVIVKDQDQVSKSESKKKEYKSKEWKQGDEVMTDTTKGAGEKFRPRMNKNGKKRLAPPPPPPQPAKP